MRHAEHRHEIISKVKHLTARYVDICHMHDLHIVFEWNPRSFGYKQAGILLILTCNIKQFCENTENAVSFSYQSEEI